MDWGIWFRKLLVNVILAGIATIIASASGLTAEAGVPWYVLAALPLILAGLKQIENLIKHI